VTDPRFDHVIESALGRVKTAVSNAIDKAGAQMGPLALSATSNLQRQVLMGVERDLQLKSGQLLSNFDKQFRAQALKTTSRQASTERPLPAAETDWASLSLVDNAEVERGVSADKLAQSLAQACERELEALQAYMTALQDDASPERNPLRPLPVAKTLLSALADLGSAEDVAQSLSQHLGRLLGPELASCYALIVADMRAQGIKPQGLSVHKTRMHGASVHGGMGVTSPASLSSELNTSSSAGTFPDSMGGRVAWPSQPGGMQTGASHAQAHMRAAQALSEMFGVSMPGAPLDGPVPMGMQAPRGGGLPAGSADFQNLLRQIAMQSHAPEWGDSTHAGLGSSAGYQPGGAHGSGADGALGAGTSGDGFAGPLMAVNLIRAHREELVRASGGAALDQMVIDIVAALFDQVLSDPKVSPQLARQIARLQMPVLRVALGDMGFFNSRKHPVRRFVNRIATLSASFEDYTAGPGRDCLDRITSLVNDIVDGDFDRMELYESKLAELESFIDTENERDAAEHAAVSALLSGKATCRSSSASCRTWRCPTFCASSWRRSGARCR
jgi:hypothetical protein